MSDELTAAPTTTSKLPGPLRNPVMIKELRSRMRGRRAFVVLTIYLTLMSGLLLMVYALFASASRANPFGPDTRQAGKVVFGAVVAVEMFLVLFIGPAFTTAAITGEKERQTYDLLRTTLLPARALVTGKLLSALSYMLLLIVASIPLQSIAFLLGGVSLVEVLLSQLVIIVAAVAYALMGLFFSSATRSTLAASISTFVVALGLTAGLPLLIGTLTTFVGPVLFGPGTPPWPLEAILIYLGLALAATNLPATIVVSEILLLERDAVLLFSEFIGGRSVVFFSPWLGFVLFHGVLAIVLFVLTVRRIRQVPRR
ncbi:MAG: hypothetical protein R3300_04420 [Candidatus Promineifilaceae bacterium]|nr:hypothetical protein [Candidatus Promineifilaceae bacterium]